MKLPHLRAGLILCALIGGLAPCSIFAQSPSDRPAAVQAPELHDGQRDFDWEIGRWRTQLSRRLRPLTGSATWVEYEGTSVVRSVWNGDANLVELDVTGSAGRIVGLSLRLYNPQTKQWSLNFASKAGGTMTVPVIGEFKDGRGEFYGADTLNGRAITARFIITKESARSWRFEQAFSADGGKTWEINWIAIDTRID